MAPGERTPFGPLSLWPLRPDSCIGSNAESLQSTRGDACPCDLHGGLCDPASDCRTLDIRGLGWQWCSTLPGAFHTIDGGLRATVPHCRLMLAISLTERGHSRRAARSDELMMFMPHNPCREIRLEPALGHIATDGENRNYPWPRPGPSCRLSRTAATLRTGKSTVSIQFHHRPARIRVSRDSAYTANRQQRQPIER